MNRCIRVIVVAWFVASAPAFALGPLCPVPGNPGYDSAYNYLDISPRTPNSSQIVTINMLGHVFAPLSIAAQVQGNVINVTLTGIYFTIGVPPPIPCWSTNVGPLPPGSYTVNAYLQQQIANAPPPSLMATAPLQVAQVEVASAIPATSPGMLGLLAALVAISGLLYWRK